MAEALYRKYRPQTFADVVGQDHIERTIRNAIEQDKVSHAYLFCGPRGTGKTTTARLLAKALLCEHGPTPAPDGTCPECQEIAAGVHPDVYELDAASRTGVENVREEIIGRVQFAPTRGRKKVYIIDEVHMLSTAAFNALLKTLEEPPDHVVFILCTTDPQKVPETIHSRCQRFDFRRIGTDSIVSRLGAVCVAEGVEFEGEALDLIAHRAEGGMRNALTALEQVIAFNEGAVTLRAAEDMLGALDSEDMAEIVNAIGARDVAACFTWTARYIETGADLAQFARDLAEHCRNMYVLSLAGADVALDITEAERRELVEEMKAFGPDRLANLLGVLGDLLSELRTSTNPRLSFEIALTRMVRPDSDLTLAALAERIEALEAGKSAVAYAPASPAPASVRNAPATTAETPAPSRKTPTAEVSTPMQTPPSAASPSPAAPQTQSAPASPEQAAPGQAQSERTGFGRTSDRSAAGGPGRSAQTAAPAAASGASYGATDPELAATLQNPAALQRIWQVALGDVKRTKPAYGVMYMNTRVSCDGAGEGIVVAFPASNSFAFMAVQKPEAVEVLSRALQQAAGRPVAFRVVKDGDAASTATPSSFQPTSQSMPAASGRPAAGPSVCAAPGATASAAAPAVVAQPSPNEAPKASGKVAAAQPVMPRLRSSSSSLGGGVRQASPEESGAPSAATAPRKAPSGQEGSDGMPADEGQMPRLAPARKNPLPVPGPGVEPPTYVREGVGREGEKRVPMPDAAVEATRVPHAREVDDDYDRVPLDAYEGVAAPDDAPPWEDGPVAGFGTESRPPALSAEDAGVSPGPAMPAPTSQASAAAPAGSEPSKDELSAFLAAGFGEGVVFKEVSE